MEGLLHSSIDGAYDMHVSDHEDIRASFEECALCGVYAFAGLSRVATRGSVN